jgi:hypothetical protein
MFESAYETDLARTFSKLPPVKHPDDPLSRLGPTLACALLAQIVSVLLAAALAAQVPGGYRVRSWVFLAQVLWSLAGTVLLLIRIASGAGRVDQRGMRLSQIGLWLVSSWVWPILVRWRRPS